MSKNLKHLLVMVIGLALALTLSGCFGTKDTLPKTASITGKVIFPQTPSIFHLPAISVLRDIDNTSIGNTVVYLDNAKYTVTSADGTFAFYSVPTGTHKLKVSDSYYESPEYSVNVTADGVANVTLNADCFAIIPVILRNSYNDTATVDLQIYNSAFLSESRVSSDKNYKVEYSTGGSFTELGSDGYYGDPYIDIDASSLQLGTEYTFKVSLINNTTGAVISSATRKITLPDFNRISPLAGIYESQPTFTWTQLPGPVLYDFRLSGSNYDGFFISGLTKASYKLPEANAITDFGDDYDWSVFAYAYDQAGHLKLVASVSAPM